MKINSLYLGIFGLMTLALAACSDDDDYSRATITGNQVYFSSDEPTKQDVSPDKNTFAIPVYRQQTEEAITVPLIVSGADTTIFSVPTSVAFAAGSNKTDLVLSYDPSRIVFGEYKGITIQIGDENYTTPYGISRYEFTIGATEWLEWKEYNEEGTCNYTYVNYWSGDDLELPFFVRDNGLNTNLHQFRIDNWGAGSPLIINYDESTGIASIEDQYLTNNSTYGAVRICDYNYYWTVIRGQELEEPVYGYFNEEEGIIALPIAYYVSAGYFGADYEYVYINGFERADATIDLTYAGKFIAADDTPYVVAKALFGDDVTSCDVALVPGALSDEGLDAILKGEYEPMQNITSEGEVRFDASDLPDGTHTFVAVSYVGDKQMEYFTTQFKYEKGVASWTPIGKGYYVEDCLLDLYTDNDDNPLAPFTYEVDIEENATKPGLYRLVDLYGAAFPYNEEGDWDDSKQWNIEVDAQDPEGVFIELQETGLDWGSGMFRIQSIGSYYVDGGNPFEAVKNAGYMGTLSNGVISFPEKGLILYLGDRGPYQGGRLGEAKVYLPGASAQANRKAIKAHLRLNRVNAAPMGRSLYHIAPVADNAAPVRDRHIK